MQPPPRGCVLKQSRVRRRKNTERQPPPRGCVLKQMMSRLETVCLGSHLRAAMC